jgi:parallel beta-helix repeat protein
VGSCDGKLASYTSIQAAINKAAAKATIYVCPGTYAEQLVITRPVTIKGMSEGTANAAVLVTPASGFVVNASSLISGAPIIAQILASEATGVNLSGIIVDGTNSGLPDGCSDNLIGILYQNASGAIAHVVTRDQKLGSAPSGCQLGEGIYVESSGSATATVVVSYSTVHDYQKGGIIGNEPGTKLTVEYSSIIGQGPAGLAADDGIQIGYGATGKITSNYIADNILASATQSASSWAASGILVYGGHEVNITGNTVMNSNLGIAVVSDPGDGYEADGAKVSSNRIMATHMFDAIDLCSSNNTVSGNWANSADESGINLDASCSLGTYVSGTGNTLKSNEIADACAGVLQGGTGNTLTSNTFYNTASTILSGATCYSANTLSTESTEQDSTLVNALAVSQGTMVHQSSPVRF